MSTSDQGLARRRRRLSMRVGFVFLSSSLLGVSALTIGAAGCIFDEGNYDGGGRRTEAPTATSTATATTPTATTTTTSPVVDSGTQPADTGAVE